LDQEAILRIFADLILICSEPTRHCLLGLSASEPSGIEGFQQQAGDPPDELGMDKEIFARLRTDQDLFDILGTLDRELL